HLPPPVKPRTMSCLPPNWAANTTAEQTAGGASVVHAAKQIGVDHIHQTQTIFTIDHNDFPLGQQAAIYPDVKRLTSQFIELDNSPFFYSHQLPQRDLGTGHFQRYLDRDLAKEGEIPLLAATGGSHIV